jgi:hypothetical protein
MNKRTGFIAALALAIAISGVLFSPATGGQESQRGECQQTCAKTYQECRKAPNANQATCKTAFDECRKNCQDVGPKPSPEVSPSPSPAASPSPSHGL